MGTWGVGSFDNDDALDWADGFANAPGIDLIEEALSAVSEMGDDEMSEADDNWIEDSTPEEWHKALSELSGRLAS